MKKFFWFLVIAAIGFAVYHYYPELKKLGGLGSKGMDKLDSRVDRMGLPIGK